VQWGTPSTQSTTALCTSLVNLDFDCCFFCFTFLLSL